MVVQEAVGHPVTVQIFIQEAVVQQEVGHYQLEEAIGHHLTAEPEYEVVIVQEMAVQQEVVHYQPLEPVEQVV